MQNKILFFLIPGFLISCGRTITDSSKLANIIDQSSFDITVMKAFKTQKSIAGTNSHPQLPFLLENCFKIAGSDRIPNAENPDTVFVTLDCTSEMERAIRENAPEIKAPVIGYTTVMATRLYRRDYPGGPGQVVTNSDYYCNLEEIQTVTRDAAFASASGIGFFVNGYTRIVDKKDLILIDRVTAKNGDALLVHRFQAAVYCWRGSMTSSSQATYNFKPFLQYKGTDGNEYRVWDNVGQNYSIQASGPDGFDRTNELLSRGSH